MPSRLLPLVYLPPFHFFSPVWLCGYGSRRREENQWERDACPWELVNAALRADTASGYGKGARQNDRIAPGFFFSLLFFLNLEGGFEPETADHVPWVARPVRARSQEVTVFVTFFFLIGNVFFFIGYVRDT